MRIWKLKKHEREYLRALNLVDWFTGTQEFKDNLGQKILRNSHLQEEEFAVLYYVIGLLRLAYRSFEPEVITLMLKDRVNIRTLDDYEINLRLVTYEEMLQNLYITYALVKTDGRAYCEGSLKYSDAEYKQRHEEIINEIYNLKPIAEKYLKGLDRFD